MLDLHALPHAVGAAGPARVDEPTGGLVLADALAQELRIDRWMARHEGSAEASGERRLRRIAEAALGTCDSRRVARKEMISRLVWSQTRDRRQHAEGVRRQHDHIRGMAGDAGQADVRDEVDGVAGARILGETV